MLLHTPRFLTSKDDIVPVLHPNLVEEVHPDGSIGQTSLFARQVLQDTHEIDGGVRKIL